MPVVPSDKNQKNQGFQKANSDRAQQVPHQLQREAALVKGGSETITKELAALNAPMPQEPAAPGAQAPSKPNYQGSMIDTLHRVLFNLFLKEQTTERSDDALVAASCSIALQ